MRVQLRVKHVADGTHNVMSCDAYLSAVLGSEKGKPRERSGWLGWQRGRGGREGGGGGVEDARVPVSNMAPNDVECRSQHYMYVESSPGRRGRFDVSLARRFYDSNNG